jgi:hypothetical protein
LGKETGVRSQESEWGKQSVLSADLRRFAQMGADGNAIGVSPQIAQIYTDEDE